MLLILFLNTVVKNAFYSGLLHPHPEKGIGYILITNFCVLIIIYS